LQQKCIIEGLAGKTIILVTHQIEFLHAANTILVMREGRIVQSGQFQELLSAGLDFESLVEAHNKSLDMVATDSGDPLLDEDKGPSLSTQLSKSLSKSYSGRMLSTGPGSPRTRSRRSLSSRQDWVDPMITEGSLSRSGSTNDGVNSRMSFDLETSSKLIEEEERSSGRVGFGVYRLYLTAAYGGAIAVVIIIIQCLWQALLLGGDYWTAYETGSSEQRFNPERFVPVYTILALLCALCVVGRAFLVAFMSLITSQDFYLKMLRSVFRAPMAFFDTTPTGRILSRVRDPPTILLTCGWSNNSCVTSFLCEPLPQWKVVVLL
jgi:ATP-binding cassette subfamily C (CFTR/MRP) protein 2